MSFTQSTPFSPKDNIFALGMLITTFNVYTRPIKADFNSFITRVDFDDTNPNLLSIVRG